MPFMRLTCPGRFQCPKGVQRFNKFNQSEFTSNLDAVDFPNMFKDLTNNFVFKQNCKRPEVPAKAFDGLSACHATEEAV